MTRTLTAVALFTALLTTGCLGSVDTASIGQATLDEHGWEQTSSDSQSYAAGAVERADLRYAPTGGGGLAAGVQVTSVTDVPILDESRYLDDAIEEIEQRHNVEFEEAGQVQIETVNFGALTGTEYDIRGAPAEGKALVVLPPCGDFVVVAAHGTTGGGGIFGSGDTSSNYQQAIQVASGVEC